MLHAIPTLNATRSQFMSQYSSMGPAMMPSPHSRWAPYFSGQTGDLIEGFLSEYEEFAHHCGLTDCQKVEAITRYVPHSLGDFWKSLNGYWARSWPDLRLSLQDTYRSTTVQDCHWLTGEGLAEFIQHSSELCMSNENDMCYYYQWFQVLIKPLLDSQTVTTSWYNMLFWFRFHIRDHTKIYVRLIAKHPDQRSAEAFDCLDVYNVARRIFSGNHHLLVDSELDDPRDGSQGFQSGQSEHAQQQSFHPEHDS